MSDQLQLPLARSTDPDTSHAAARAARDGQSELAAEVLTLFRRLGPLTDFELCVELPGRVPGSVIKRRGELVAAGLVRDSGRRRVNRHHRKCVVWILEEDNDE